jgi:succinate dehydrogenase hydrophobic anchor subunit
MAWVLVLLSIVTLLILFFTLNAGVRAWMARYFDNAVGGATLSNRLRRCFVGLYA